MPHAQSLRPLCPLRFFAGLIADRYQFQEALAVGGGFGVPLQVGAGYPGLLAAHFNPLMVKDVAEE